MDLVFSIAVARGAVIQILLVAGPLLLVGLVVGLLISIFQATTSIQEQTLTFVPKIAAILVTLLFFGPWMVQTLMGFTQVIFSYIPEIAR